MADFEFYIAFNYCCAFDSKYSTLYFTLHMRSTYHNPFADKFAKCTSHVKYKGQCLCSQKRANANVVPASAADPEYLHFDEVMKNGL